MEYCSPSAMSGKFFTEAFFYFLFTFDLQNQKNVLTFAGDERKS